LDLINTEEDLLAWWKDDREIFTRAQKDTEELVQPWKEHYPRYLKERERQKEKAREAAKAEAAKNAKKAVLKEKKMREKVRKILSEMDEYESS
jgi:chromatin segregation and condensation protein Rec8/ScpA/Scc1 (kleisin family)